MLYSCNVRLHKKIFIFSRELPAEIQQF
jgi:hypothetical protein